MRSYCGHLLFNPEKMQHKNYQQSVSGLERFSGLIYVRGKYHFGDTGKYKQIKTHRPVLRRHSVSHLKTTITGSHNSNQQRCIYKKPSILSGTQKFQWIIILITSSIMLTVYSVYNKHLKLFNTVLNYWHFQTTTLEL